MKSGWANPERFVNGKCCGATGALADAVQLAESPQIMDELGAEIYRRLDELGAISEEPDRLTRTFLSEAQQCASELVLGWMQDAGMEARIDAIGNVVGRCEGVTPDLPALVLGSHLDTVRDAGKYDGMLGVVTAIACIEELHRGGERLPFAIEVIGFSDEEGVRFGATMLGSRAVAGTFDPELLSRSDDNGTSMEEALHSFGLDPIRLGEAAHRPEDILAYVELHIEQGPVLEQRGLPAGCVTSISGATRFLVDITGEAGHAGTVPMGSRRDALAASAACIAAIETRCSAEEGLVGTVGRLEVSPGAINVIPGHARFSIDIRAPEDAQRQRCVADVLASIEEIGKSRNLTVDIKKIHDLPAARCAPWLMDQIDRAIESAGIEPFRLPSGAGHDGMAMIAVADIGMIFIRCAGGVSHNPAEAITVEDAGIGAQILLSFIRNLMPKPA
jgi:allantoate deiminase